MATSHTVTAADRVPVEHRVLGLDRRSFGLALVALLVYALWAWIMPWVNDQVAWDDPIRAGDVIQVTDDVTMTPPTGWGLAGGLRTSDETLSGRSAASQTVLFNDGISVSISTGGFTGSPAELVKETDLIDGANGDFKARTQASTTTTSTGVTGVLQGFQTQQLAGIVAGFVVKGQGISVQIVGPPDQMSQQSETIGRMLDTLTVTTDGSGS